MKTVIIIPARMASTRLPGKALRTINGETVIWSCYSGAMASKLVDKVYVASPDSEILSEIIKKTNLDGIVTSENHVNGTDRIAEAARLLELQPDDIVVNLQGDMPFFDSEIINVPVELMKSISDCKVASVMTKLSKQDYNDPSRVKVTVDDDSKATLFNRKYQNNSYLHIGVYVFRNSFLQRYATYGPTTEEIESNLEQQRVMHMGEPIYMAYVDNRPVVIDTKEDLEKARYDR